jgi:hypothetical protein
LLLWHYNTTAVAGKMVAVFSTGCQVSQNCRSGGAFGEDAQRTSTQNIPAPYFEAVKKPIALSAKESARVFLWIALADLGGFVFPLFSVCGGF